MSQLEVLVATPERFDAMLRLRPHLLSFIRCVVFDEAHMIGSDLRGIRLECILTRLRLAEQRGEPSTKVCAAIRSSVERNGVG